jgi:predicted ATPase/class 3 adenylate cyclase
MSDVRALLLTDVVDSTKLSEEIGDAAMAEVWAGHDRVARDLLPQFGGREIDKTDGMLLMFDLATQAVEYALAYHKAIGSLPTPLKARAGLHVGAVILRENSPEDVARGAKPLEVDGLAKPTAARVMSIARGAQTLITPEARQSLGQTALKIESHGHWMIKGVSEPIELFEVGEQGQRFIPPPDSEKCYRVIRNADWWLPVKDIPNNLPFQATSFVGRERELDEVKALLKKSRLITLLGMGGLGKTRLSLQVAAETIQDYPDGAWFLDLSALRDEALVAGETARVLNVSEEPDRPLIQTLCAHLKTRRALLVVDNCEHLVHACAELTSAILKVAPHVRFITSSREALRVPGEHTYPIMPLPLPRPGDSLERIAQSTAVQLFVARAQQHKPSFELNEREAPAVAELVSRLEGIPLALELAAARVRAMSVADINKRLKDRYKILTGGDRVLQERQQTLRALVDWSYELLNPNEQCLLGRLAVFLGGFELSAAEEVCGVDPIDAMDVLDLLQSLVEKSLVMLDESGDSTRYRMLETIREYAAEKLDQSGEKEALAAGHCKHYFGVAKLIRDGLLGAEFSEALRRGESEIDNLRAAIALSLAGGVDAVLSVKFCVALQNFWIMRGYASEGRGLVKSALELPSVQSIPVAHAHALYVGAGLAESQSDHAEAREMLETCLGLRRGLGDKADVASTLSTLSLTRLQAGDADGALAAETEALALFREVKHRIGEMIGLIHLGQIEVYRGDDEAARKHLEPALMLAKALKHQEGEGVCEVVLGESAFESGDMARAGVRFKRSLTVCEAAGDKRGAAMATWWLGRIDLEGGQLESARNRLHTALRAFREFEARNELLTCLEDCAVLAHLAGDIGTAVRVGAAATTLRERLSLARSARSASRWKTRSDAMQAAAGDSYMEYVIDGEMWDVENAMGSALAAH